MKLLEQLVSVPGPVSDEGKIKEFVLNYVLENSSNWKVQPKIIHGEEWQEMLILVFGKPKTAIFAHIDTIGFSTGYGDDLIKVGGPRLIDGTILVGEDSKGPVEVELALYEDEDGSQHPHYISDRLVDRGTLLTFKPDFRETENYIQSPYMDNRLGVYCALKVAETIENGAIVFSTYEEHGGNSVASAAKYLQDNYGTRQALISDITWVTDGVVHGNGVAISMRDSGLPRRAFLNRIIEIAKQTDIPFQLEVESSGGSDGGMLQKSDVLYDWCFIGAAEDNVHTPDEIVHKKDIQAMIDLYVHLMEKL